MLVVKDVLNCNACLHSADIVVKQFLPHEPFSNFLQGSEGFTRVCPVPPCSLHHPPHMHACVCAWRCSPHRHNTCTQCASLFSLLFFSLLFFFLLKLTTLPTHPRSRRYNRASDGSCCSLQALPSRPYTLGLVKLLR